MLTPAMIPVTAGKKTAKTTAKGSPSGLVICTSAGGSGVRPRKNDSSDRPIAAMTKYCVLIARSAPLSEIRVRTTQTAEAAMRGSRLPARVDKLSAKPTT